MSDKWLNRMASGLTFLVMFVAFSLCLALVKDKRVAVLWFLAGAYAFGSIGSICLRKGPGATFTQVFFLLVVILALLSGCASRTRTTEAMIRLSNHQMRSDQARQYREIDNRISQLESRVMQLEIHNRKSPIGQDASARTREQIRLNLQESAREYTEVMADAAEEITAASQLTPKEREWLRKGRESVAEMERLRDEGLKKIYGRVPQL